jgi:hypothetical protein
MGDESLSLEEYENLTVVEDAGEIISEISSGPSIEDLYMLVFVQLQRIYDLLALQISLGTDGKALERLNALHVNGEFLAPLPQINQGEDNA